MRGTREGEKERKSKEWSGEESCWRMKICSNERRMGRKEGKKK